MFFLLLLPPQGGGLLTLFRGSSEGSLPPKEVLHELLQHRSFLRAAVLMSCSSLDPVHVAQSFRNRLLQCVFPTGSQVLPGNSSVGSSLCGSTGPARSLLQHGLPMGSQLPLVIHLLWCWALYGLQVEICSTINLHGLQGDSLLCHGLLHGLQGNLCSGAWSTSSPSFLTDLGVYRVVYLTSSHLTLCCCCLSSRFVFPS